MHSLHQKVACRNSTECLRLHAERHIPWQTASNFFHMQHLEWNTKIDWFGHRLQQQHSRIDHQAKQDGALQKGTCQSWLLRILTTTHLHNQNPYGNIPVQCTRSIRPHKLNDHYNDQSKADKSQKVIIKPLKENPNSSGSSQDTWRYLLVSPQQHISSYDTKHKSITKWPDIEHEVLKRDDRHELHNMNSLHFPPPRILCTEFWRPNNLFILDETEFPSSKNLTDFCFGTLSAKLSIMLFRIFSAVCSTFSGIFPYQYK